jgi:hypothetical protein
LLPGSPIGPSNGPITAASSFSRLHPDDALNFPLPSEWYLGDAEFWTDLVLPPHTPDSNPANNRFPSGSGRFRVRFADVKPLSLRYVLVHYTHPTWRGPRSPQAHVALDTTCAWLRSVYPVSYRATRYDPWDPPEISFGRANPQKGDLDGDRLITLLNTLYATNPSGTDQLFGWTPEGSFSDHGLADAPQSGGHGRVAFGNDTLGAKPPTTSRYRRTFAHEIGHNLGLRHTKRCMKNDEYGYDVYSIDPFGRRVMRCYPPSDPMPATDLLDFMAPSKVEPHAWVAPSHYVRLYQAFAAPSGPKNQPRSGGKTGDRKGFPRAGNRQEALNPEDMPPELLVVRGQVTREGSGRFFPFHRIPASTDNIALAGKLPREGTHAVRFLADAEKVLLAIAWTPEFDAEDDDEPVRSRPFTWFVRPIAGVSRVELWIRDKIVDQCNVLPIGPVIKGFRQDPVELRNDKESVRLTWDAFHPVLAPNEFRERLVHQVFYSANDGKTWRLVAADLDQPEAHVNLASLPGGKRCVFMVATSDGYNSANSKGRPFAVPDRRPSVKVIDPMKQLTIAEGTPLRLLGHAYDLEDGALTGKQLTWESDVQEKLGFGEELTVSKLKPGRHRISLRATDSAGNQSAAAEVVIVVNSKEER